MRKKSNKDLVESLRGPLSASFNEWMRRYIETPEQFAREFQEVTSFVAEQADGKVPTYGDNSVEMLIRCLQIEV